MDASLKGRLEHSVRDFLARLIVVPSDHELELLNSIYDLREIIEIASEVMSQHTEEGTRLFRLLVINEASPRLCTFSSRHVLQPTQCLSIDTQCQHVEQRSRPTLVFGTQTGGVQSASADRCPVQQGSQRG